MRYSDSHDAAWELQPVGKFAQLEPSPGREYHEDREHVLHYEGQMLCIYLSYLTLPGPTNPSSCPNPGSTFVRTREGGVAEPPLSSRGANQRSGMGKASWQLTIRLRQMTMTWAEAETINTPCGRGPP